MEAWALIRTNRAAWLMNLVICITLTAGYILDVVKGRKTLFVVIIFLFFILLQQVFCTISFNRSKDSPRFKYYILLSYAVVYCFAIFASETYFTYVFIFPVIVLYVLYQDVTLMRNASVLIIALNIVKVVFQVVNGHTESDDITGYTVQMACVILVLIGLYVDTKITVAINHEKIEKLREYAQKFEDNSRTLLYQSIDEQLSKTEDIVNFTGQIKGLSREIIALLEVSSASLDSERVNLSNLHDAAVKLDELIIRVHNGITELNTLAANITATVDSISDTAFTTNILAINASIEAARTSGGGTQGFAAVADEVKRLAAQSGESANKITAVTEDLVSRISTALNEVSYLVENNDSQNRAISEVDSTCASIVENITDLSQKVRNLDSELDNLSKANRDIAESARKITDIAAMSQNEDED